MFMERGREITVQRGWKSQTGRPRFPESGADHSVKPCKNRSSLWDSEIRTLIQTINNPKKKLFHAYHDLKNKVGSPLTLGPRERPLRSFRKQKKWSPKLHEYTRCLRRKGNSSESKAFEIQTSFSCALSALTTVAMRRGGNGVGMESQVSALRIRNHESFMSLFKISVSIRVK